ncbi:MAG: DUF4465 domain-containing protein, partial [Bacteroidales bacterium]|nr:DUF4465 domain-containing protein [Candidatus Colicola faecequi]
PPPPLPHAAWFKFTEPGKNNRDTTCTGVLFVVDNRKEGNWKYAENWQWMDLSTLGEVDELVFDVDGSDKDDWGLNTPAYFCFDNLGGQAADCQLGEMSVVKVNALEDVNATEAEKYFENGHIFIKKAGKVYNAAGMLVK